MRVIEVRVARTMFADTLGQMRQWLDSHNQPRVRFETETDSDGMIGMKVEFEANELAEQFRQSFRGSYTDGLAGGHADLAGSGRHRHAQGLRQPGVQAQTVLGKDPFSGHVFCFRGRRGDLVKLLWWDGDGLCLFAKRLESGRFVWPRCAENRTHSNLRLNWPIAS
jgi:hypothetical protein